MFAIIGYVIAFGCVFGVYILHGGNVDVLAKALPFEMATIGGSALGAFLVSNPPKVLKATIAAVAAAFKGGKQNKARFMDLLALLYDILQKARKEGLMSIEGDVEEPQNSPMFQKYPALLADHHLVDFMTDYLRMMVSGNLNSHEIESLMDNEIDAHHQEAHRPVVALQRLAGALPAFGIVAAVLGGGEHHGLGGAAPLGVGWDDCLGAGRDVFGDFAGLRFGRTHGLLGRAQCARCLQRVRLHQMHLDCQHARLQPAHCD